MQESYRQPLYTIGIVAKLLGVCAATLRIWEKKGLIRPKRLGRNRFYSPCDMDRLRQIKTLLQKKRINIEGVKSILEARRCWEIKKCQLKEREVCPVYLKHSKS
jgi:MerR family transcriptional regulator/heat shock protein HspR